MRYVDFHGYKIYEDGTIISKYGREITKRLNNGRYEVRLHVNGKRVNYTLSRLVYYVFKPFNIENKDLCVSYKDDNKLNVHLNNLYLTHRKNLIQGDNHKNRAKLTNEQVKEIRRLYKGTSGANQHDKKGYSLQDLANKYGVSKGNIRMIVTGESRNKKAYKLV